MVASVFGSLVGGVGTLISGNQLRLLILEESKRANVGHIGSALSVADIIAVLFGDILNFSPEDAFSRDRFILSKGHAALALYAALYCKGFLDRKELATYCQDGTLLGTHPEPIPGTIDFGTGSLGHGLSFGVGAAIASRMDRSTRRVYVLVSDAELNEGSHWEAVMFAAHHKLDVLTAVVDYNGQQAMGKTRDILSLDPLRDRWSAFGWQAIETDGHDPAALKEAFQNAASTSEKPSVIIAKTTAGKGVSFMENLVQWHYLPMTDEQYVQACSEIRELSCEPRLPKL